MQFTPESNAKKRTNNYQKRPFSVKNYSTLRILMGLWKIMGCVVFNLIPNSCESDEILATIKTMRIKYGFMRVTIQILNAALETLEKISVGATVWVSI